MNEETKVIPLPKYEDCEDCNGTGMRKYNAVFIDGDLYQDAEVCECDSCDGSGKIKIENNEQHN